MLHIDIPTHEELVLLAAHREAASVSIYLETSPVTLDNEGARIRLKNQAGEVSDQLRAVGTSKADIEAIEAELKGLLADTGFWAYLSWSLVIFVTPHDIVTYRVPNHLSNVVEVADRFYLKPLLRTITFPQVAFVLAISQGAVRLVEVSPDAPAFEVEVADLPVDAAAAVGLPSISGRSGGYAGGRVQGSEGQKVRLLEYSQVVNRAIRPVLRGLDVPLVLKGVEPIVSIYRGANTYPHLAAQVLRGSGDKDPDAALAEQVRPVLDAVYADRLTAEHEVFDQRTSAQRTATALDDVARAATSGAVETLFIDIAEIVPGTVDEKTGAVTLSESNDAHSYGVTDEIARRVLLTGGRIFAVRTGEVPGNGQVAATLRYRV